MNLGIRRWTLGDEERIGDLWGAVATSGRAVEREGSGLIYMSRDLWRIADSDGQVVGAFRKGRQVRVESELIQVVRPCLADNPTADTSLTAYMSEEARDDRCTAIDFWRLTSQGPPPVDHGFHVERVFLRLDREPAEFTATALPPGIVAIWGTDPRADQAAFLNLYNRAFEGEWLHQPEDAETWAKLTANKLVLAAIDDAAVPIGLLIGHMNIFLAAHERPNPVAEIQVLCTAEEWRGRHIAKHLTSVAIARFTTAGAKIVSILADLGSRHASYRIYERWGFSRAVEWQVWEGRLA